MAAKKKAAQFTVTQGHLYTVRELFDGAKLDPHEIAKVDYGEGHDLSRLKVGGLNFQNLDDVIRIGDDAEQVVITLLDDEQATIPVVSE